MRPSASAALLALVVSVAGCQAKIDPNTAFADMVAAAVAFGEAADRKADAAELTALRERADAATRTFDASGNEEERLQIMLNRLQELNLGAWRYVQGDLYLKMKIQGVVDHPPPPSPPPPKVIHLGNPLAVPDRPDWQRDR